jgi:hypothetical protein
MDPLALTFEVDDIRPIFPLDDRLGPAWDCVVLVLVDLTEKMEVDPLRLALSINAFAAFSFRPSAGGDDSFSFSFWVVVFLGLAMVIGGLGISRKLDPVGLDLVANVVCNYSVSLSRCIKRDLELTFGLTLFNGLGCRSTSANGSYSSFRISALPWLIASFARFNSSVRASLLAASCLFLR